MSADPSAILDAAHMIVADQLNKLRALVEQMQKRSEQLSIELRQAERLLDEAMIQHRFAAEQGLSNTSALAGREKSLRADRDALEHNVQVCNRALKQLDQLIRQIDMSSATLQGGSEDEPDDPWVQALRSQIIKGREEERVRLAREVHDGPAQVLANTLMGLEHSRTLLKNQHIERLDATINRMCNVTRTGLQEVRRFIADLRPGRLAEQGLVAALHDYIHQYRDACSAHVVFEADRIPRLASEVEIVLYRTVQEALQNAYKHARGATVHVTLSLHQNRLTLSIRDDGPGFDPREVARRAGRESWGLTSMRERSELIGARFVVSARPGMGTEITVMLPLQASVAP